MEKRFDWIDALKAFAIIGILLNHLVETFVPGPWFTNPSSTWPDFSTRMQQVFPQSDSLFTSLLIFMGWLGDSGPGVFILLSGLGLTLAQLKKASSDKISIKEFFVHRVLKLFPLYIAIHIFILGGSIIFGSTNYMSDPRVLLSLTGLRFTDSTFFFINPSWWFIWLILQMYIVFPFLFYLLKNTNVKIFLLLTFIFTFLSRLLGILELQPGKLYYWMTGIFFGTRLAEFTLGMAIGWLIINSKELINKISDAGIFLLGIFIYLSGLAFSFTLSGSIFSNLLVSTGLCGIFYGIWELIIKKKFKFITASLIWIGISSYSVYLIHQPLLLWTNRISSQSIQLLAAAAVLIISFPLGLFFERLIKKIPDLKFLFGKEKLINGLLVLLSALLIGLLLFIDQNIGTTKRYAAYEFILFLIALLLIFLGTASKKSHLKTLVISSAILSIILTLFVFPKQSGFISLITATFFFLTALITYQFVRSTETSISFSVIVCVLAYLILENLLKLFSPVETIRWGEFEALQKHPTRTYSLIPNKETQLIYNNYNYKIRTNSSGLVSPEIDLQKKTNVCRILVLGDAFTMPEGVRYEDSYTALLQKKLNIEPDRKTFEVINAGVTGYGPAEQLPQLRELGKVLRPDLILHEFFINEFHEASLTPAARLNNIGFDLDDLSFNEKLFGSSQLFNHLHKIISEISDRFSGNKRSWKYYKSLLHFYETENNHFYDSLHLANLYNCLMQMKSAADSLNAGYKIVFVPAAIAVSKPDFISYYPTNINISNGEFDFELPLKKLLNITNQINIPVLDLTNALKSFPEQPVYFSESWHWNNAGHKAAAEKIFEMIHQDSQMVSSEKEKLKLKPASYR